MHRTDTPVGAERKEAGAVAATQTGNAAAKAKRGSGRPGMRTPTTHQGLLGTPRLLLALKHRKAVPTGAAHGHGNYKHAVEGPRQLVARKELRDVVRVGLERKACQRKNAPERRVGPWVGLVATGGDHLGLHAGAGGGGGGGGGGGESTTGAGCVLKSR